MKKIILSLAILALVGAGVFGITRAYFSDTETSTGNTFSAGTIDIAVDGSNPWKQNYSIGDLKPGETGNITFDIQNVGQNPVNVSKNVGNFVESTGTVSEPECTDQGGYWDNPDGGCNWTWDGTHTDNNDVQTQILYDLSVKVYGTPGEGNLIWWQTIYTDAENKSLTDVYGTGGTEYVDLGMIPVGGHMMVTQSYHFDYNAGNEYQGDTLSFDITIKADQLAQGDNGLASVVLENKTAGPEYDVITTDDYKGTLTYKTTNPTFDFSFTGKVTQPSTNYTLLYAVDPWPQTGSKVLGTTVSDGSGIVNFSGTATPGSIANGKVWLVLSTDWNSTNMIGWHQPDYLLETGLINYTQN